MRWRRHYLATGEHFNQVWQAVYGDAERRILFILGLGFDPRCLYGLQNLLALGVFPTCCKAVEYGSGRDNRDEGLLDRAQHNRDQFSSILKDEIVDRVRIQTLSDDGRHVGGRRIVEAFNSPEIYAGYTDVVVDISGLPPGLYFPLVATLLQLSNSAIPNLHVIVSDNPALDSRIVAEGGDRAEMIIGFEGGTERASTVNPLPVWAPVLGEQARSQLRTIGTHRDWTLIHPVLPFPSKSPRRGDQLVADYHDLIFDEWQAEPEDFIYADEQNPFDVYQALVNLATSVRSSLDSIGTSQILVSCHSSKLLSLGVLLAAFEENIGVIHVQPTGYLLDATVPQDADGELYEVWLTGEPYAINRQ